MYLVQWLNYSEDSATTVYHAFIALCFLTPIFGGVVADSWLGRFKCVQ